jgi:hypothetical protein
MSQQFVAVPISLDVFREFISRHPYPHSVIEDVLSDFLDRTADDRSPAVKKKVVNGLLWGAAFLPEKTRIRTKWHGEYVYAEVKSDSILYDGERFSSVGAAINKMRGDTSNNAWKVTQVQRPTDVEWLWAGRIRKQGV